MYAKQIAWIKWIAICIHLNLASCGTWGKETSKLAKMQLASLYIVNRKICKQQINKNRNLQGFGPRNLQGLSVSHILIL